MGYETAEDSKETFESEGGSRDIIGLHFSLF